jgi:TRAP-type mannitol/chloroaromatic compound transport system permease small subunit
MLGMAFTLREKGHIRIDVLFSRFEPKTQAMVDLFGYLFLLLPVSFWLSWALWSYAYDAYLIGETTGESAWNPIVWPFRMSFFAGFVLLSLQGVMETIRVIYILRDQEIHREEEEIPPA